VTYLVALLPRKQIDQVVLERHTNCEIYITARYFSVQEAETLDISETLQIGPLFDIYKAKNIIDYCRNLVERCFWLLGLLPMHVDKIGRGCCA
jgi:hypothetical protein